MNRAGRGANGLRRRAVNTRATLPRLLVVCEGARTEPNYFNAFPVPSMSVEVVGTGKNTRSLVEEAIRRAKGSAYDEVWWVFDRDSFKADQVNAAVDMVRARAKNKPAFRLAFSNECFEIWYILHFCFINAAVSRTTYADRLTGFLGRPYKKNDPDMYVALLPKQPDALRNACARRALYEDDRPAENNPWTSVDDLVRRLNEIARQAHRLE